MGSRKQPHAVCVPFSSTRSHKPNDANRWPSFYTLGGFYITFINTEFNHRRLLQSKDESFQSDGSLDTTIDWIPGMRNIRLKDMPSFIRTTDPNDILFNYLSEEVQNCLKASAIVFNTFGHIGASSIAGYRVQVP
ncbi:UDP-glycosyltransferase 85A7 [Camellia lanceoleosa]|uniref:UDP-glycosyltransferase 85A7 n=1 Tax=Camellia lanceoleosa TaxID=1840588 RepID=A0ACC0HXQ0_9ERIC|nr:UDP-glycosyltransferase 85A7 [Camellia lanceoleosa]